jgi:large subunit ribosomal protein L9
MKVILLRDVAKIGRRFEVKEVPDGFALNKLIPQKMAEPATPANLKRIAAKHKSDVVHTDMERSAALLIVQACTETPLVVEMVANEQGHLFQAVHAMDVVLAAKARGFTLTEASLAISSPIKSVGDHAVELLSAGEKFSLPITVSAKAK